MSPYRLLEIIHWIIHKPETLLNSRFSQKSFTRNRKMRFADVLCFFLDMSKTTLQTRLNMFFGRKQISMSEQAFSKARNKFDHSPFETMHRALMREEYGDIDTLNTWKGHIVLSVDGSYYLLPKRKELQDAFGTRGQGNRCVSAGTSVLYDVINGFPIDPILTHSNMSEREECRKHIEYLSSEMPHVAAKSLVLLDRGYPSTELFKHFDEKKIKFLARCAKNYSWATQAAPMGSSIVELSQGYQLRVLKILLENGEIETLITNLYDIPDEELVGLYAMRWGIEGFYNKLKNVVSIEKFTGRTENAIRQDFWVSMVLMVAVAVFQRDADKMAEIKRKGKGNKHVYKARTSDLVVNMRNNFIFSVFRNDANCMNRLDDLIELCAYSVSAVQPGRHFLRVFTNSSNRHDNRKSLL